ncbi:phosphoribosylamine--glycine ligase [Dethiosulfatibacter aminovorans DSM 17477]|uniref:Phosphoribosylamine--glycine ligase n=1 Tax=Dethiosulfatibacter aminovorans DSM 17477 TaxID=1121476 RepID=A0A1M6FP41_9FIRM|nr:phosphoribosylamine--glycine ligase [Dethiosulfatibacter aminovorans]SHI99450.1 phosphoribosylamine--glycine ligase [Dethiosulfatibacter aminovorans DSM 17477]
MKVLVIGSGGREHAICWKVKQSPLVEKLYCMPGNAGISEIAECVDIKVEDLDAIVEFALENNIDLAIIGPEVPLVMGLSDKLSENGIKSFGPNKMAAEFEGSKAFSKRFMEKYNIPTAAYGVYDNPQDALDGLENFSEPVVVKADGLAAGKGVLICQKMDEAVEAIKSIMESRQFGEAGDTVVVEEFLTGIEASLLCFVDGERIIPMESARDYKKAFDNDEGLNTGGMGCFSPNPIYTDKLQKFLDENILNNIIDGFKKDGIDYHGVLFIGLMIENDEAKVLEFNVRFGDPETQVVLPRMKSDIVEVMLKTIDGNLGQEDLMWNEQESVTVVLASGGYPEGYEKGKTITGLETVDEDIIVFHAGTKFDGDDIVTNGGRVLAVTCVADSIEKARERVYDNLPKIEFEKKQYRTDIAKL